MLRRGELLPKSTPARRVDGNGYVRLIWRVEPGVYVEVYEHRIEHDEVLGSYVTYAHWVKHCNDDRSDNRPENLQFIYANTPGRRRMRTR